MPERCAKITALDGEKKPAGRHLLKKREKLVSRRAKGVPNNEEWTTT